MPEPRMRRPACLWWVAAHADAVVEQDEVDGDLERSGRDVVLRIQERVVLHGHVADIAVTVDAHRAQIGAAGALEVLEQGERLGRGLRHGVDQVEARARVREDVRDEDPLIDLEPLLVLLQQLALGGDGGAARQVLGKLLGCGVDELGDAQLPPEAVRETGVDRLHVATQVLDPGHVGLRHRAGHALAPRPGVEHA